MTRISVALIEPVGSHGGMDYYDCGLVAGLIENGVPCVWYSCDVSEVRGSSAVKLKRTFRGIWGKAHPLLRGVRYLKGLATTLLDARKEGLTVAHLHFFHVGMMEFISVMMARLSGLAVFVTVHDVEDFSRGAKGLWLQKLIYDSASGLIVHNEVSRTELLSYFPDLVSKLTVVPHGSYLGLVPTLITKDKAREALELSSDERVILFFGQIKAVKGLDILIKAFAKIASSDRRYRLLIAGKVWKEEFYRYQRMIDETGLARQFYLNIRYIPDAEIPLFYGAADVVVLPYRKIYQSGVLLMAMSLGVPVIVSDLPGMTAIVSDKQNGLVFKSGDDQHLATVLDMFFSNADLGPRLVQTARADMREHYGWSSIGKQLAAFYQEVMR